MLLLPPILVLAVLYFARMSQTGFHVDPAAIVDTDTMMRLSYLREILAHGWQQGYFWRDNAPYGSMLHWTKPFYCIVLALYEVFRTVLPPERALVYAGYFTGPFMALVACGATYWAARAVVSRQVASVTTLAIVLSNSFFVYNKLGTANHHSLLLIDYIVMIGFMIHMAQRPQSLLIALGSGLAAAFAVWTSFEMLVAAGLVYGFVFYLWVLDGQARYRQVLAFATSYAALITVSCLIDPPLGGYHAMAFDHPAVPGVVLAALPLTIVLIMRLLPMPDWRQRLAYVAIAGSAALSFWFWLYFVHLAAVMQHMDPAVSTEMDPTILEWVHITRLWSTLAILGNGIVGLVVGAAFLPRNRYYPLIIGFLLVLGFAAREHLRFAGYFWVAGTFVTATVLQRGLDRKPDMTRMLALMAAGAALILFCQGLGTVLHNRSDPHWQDAGEACSIPDVAPVLNDPAWLRSNGPNPIFAGELEFTPALLFWTQVRTVAGYYHRDIPGVADDMSLFRDTGDMMARGIIADRGIQYLLICPGMGGSLFGAPSLALYYKRVKELAGNGPPTLYTRLTIGRIPDWLTPRPWPKGVDSDLKLFQVNDRADPAEK